jgi:MFS family permease
VTTPFQVLGRMWPLVTAVTLGMLSLGISLPVIPSRVHDTLGFGTVTVGITVSMQSLTTLLSRQFAGSVCDRRGSRPGMLIGTLMASASGLLYLLSAMLPLGAGASLFVLILGRVAMGVAESFVITSGLSWSMSRVRPDQAGQAMAWNGLAFLLAIAVGAPIGTALAGLGGFGLVGFASMLVPLAAFVIGLAQPPMRPVGGKRMSFLRVVRLVALPGSGLLLANIGFGCLAAFVVLDFQAHGWPGGALALAAYAGAFVVPRLVVGGLPDKARNAWPTLITLSVAAIGQALLFAAPEASVAMLGAVLTGLGLSLSFPLFGVPAMRRVPLQNRGAAIGVYNAFMDLSLGLAGPVAGAIAAATTLDAVFLFGFACAIAAMGPAGLLHRVRVPLN